MKPFSLSLPTVRSTSSPGWNLARFREVGSPFRLSCVFLREVLGDFHEGAFTGGFDAGEAVEFFAGEGWVTAVVEGAGMGVVCGMNGGRDAGMVRVLMVSVAPSAMKRLVGMIIYRGHL